MKEFSIIITSHNYSRYLNRSIRSAFTQNFPSDDYEIIVVDDCSDDWSKEIIESYGKYIKKIYLDKNVGLPATRNVGIRYSSGRFITFLDADDYLNRDYLNIAHKFLIYNPLYMAVAFDYFITDDYENVISRKSCGDNPIACGISFRREVLIDIGLYDEEFRIHEDKELMMRLGDKFKILYVSIPLYRYRKHSGSLSSNVEESEKYMRMLEDKHGKQ